MKKNFKIKKNYLDNSKKNRKTKTRNRRSHNRRKTYSSRRSKIVRIRIFKFFSVIVIISLLISFSFYIVKILKDMKQDDSIQVLTNEEVSKYKTIYEEDEQYIEYNILEQLDCFIYSDNDKEIVVTPSENYYLIDATQETIVNGINNNVVNAIFYEDNIYIRTSDIQKISNIDVIQNEKNNYYELTTNNNGTVSVRLNEQKNEQYFNIKKIGQYYDYIILNPYDSSEEAVLYCNANLNNGFYTKISEITNPSDILVLVNKYNHLPSTYEPDDLVEVTDGKMLRKEAYEAYEAMEADMNDLGLTLFFASSYRSYDRQNELYNNYASSSSNAEADIYSARPGHSEHQTGLAVDILHTYDLPNGMSGAHFENTKQYGWLIENAYRYGFILRYPQGMEHITGYMFEPWHWRYVGVEVATYMKENNIATLEELYARKSVV